MRLSVSVLTRSLCLALTAALLVASFNTQPVRAEAVVHVVQPGENLFRIGLKYGVGWPAIMQANGLTTTTIYVGQQLLIPTEGTAPEQTPAPTASATPVPEAPPSAPTQPGTYIVQPGDTLFKIAVRYGLTVQQLAAANNIYNPSFIYTGQTLVIPGADSTTSPAPAPAPSPGIGKRILIDISEQHLYAYEGDAMVFSFVASTGLPGLDTWPGTYSVLNKIPNAYGATWNIWMPNWLGIYWAGRLQNGIHALPILPNGSRLWDGYLGTPVSYGCIILGIEASQMLYDWAEVGIPVVVQY
jgi:LysM repeat protein